MLLERLLEEDELQCLPDGSAPSAVSKSTG
jgi:hypothetical protein